MMVSMIAHERPRPRPRPRNTSTSKLPLLPLIAVSILLLSSLCTNIVAALDYGEKDVEVNANANANANDIVNVNAIVEEEKEIEEEEEEEEEEEITDGTIRTKRVKKDVNENDNNKTNNNSNCQQSTYEPSVLSDPCKLDKTPISISSSDSSNSNNNEYLSLFSILFPTQYGDFVADCDRRRAPVQADRIYRLAKYGYYNQNYFFRVIPGKYIQFGTNGDPAISNMYNYNYNYNYNNTSTTTTTTTTTKKDQLLSNNNCSIIQPQPPYMAREIPGLSNSFGTISMSTSYKDDIVGYPNGVTWNATAELFINIGNNDWLDANLFVPICTINKYDMENVVLKFPSFGEVFELGGDGPSLDLLYQDGNNYIESNIDTNPTWNDTMAITSIVSICDTDTSSSSSSDSNSDSDYVVERDDEF